MTLQDLKAGKEFKVGGETFLKLYMLTGDNFADNTYCITQFGNHKASIREMNEEEIVIYSFFFGKMVESVIKISEVEDMEDYLARIKEAEEQERQDEYGIGAYSEEA